MSDPLGRRALFSPPPAPPGSAGAGSRRSAGKESLYSAATAGDRRLGTVVVDCSACAGRSRLTLVEFMWRHLPFWLWVPWARHSNWMTCPACERRTWLGVSWVS